MTQCLSTKAGQVQTRLWLVFRDALDRFAKRLDRDWYFTPMVMEPREPPTAAEPVQQPAVSPATPIPPEPSAATVAPPTATADDPMMDAFRSSSDLDATRRWAFGNWKDHPAPEGASSLFVGLYRDAGEPSRRAWRVGYMALEARA